MVSSLVAQLDGVLEARLPVWDTRREEGREQLTSTACLKPASLSVIHAVRRDEDSSPRRRAWSPPPCLKYTPWGGTRIAHLDGVLEARLPVWDTRREEGWGQLTSTACLKPASLSEIHAVRRDEDSSPRRRAWSPPPCLRYTPWGGTRTARRRAGGLRLRHRRRARTRPAGRRTPRTPSPSPCRWSGSARSAARRAGPAADAPAASRHPATASCRTRWTAPCTSGPRAAARTSSSATRQSHRSIRNGSGNFCQFLRVMTVCWYRLIK